jgi:GNAT-family acetyltransferase (TIGR03103 family)
MTPENKDSKATADPEFGEAYLRMASLKNWGEAPGAARRALTENTILDCGWGRLVFGQTFSDSRVLADTLREERPGRRDIAIYLRDPHVVLSYAPQELFLDPSHTFRLWFKAYNQRPDSPPGLIIRRVESLSDTECADRIYRSRHMVPPYEGFIWRHRGSSVLTYLVAEDTRTGAVVGVVTGVDHKHAINDPDNGSSLWALAVDPQCQVPGVGEALVRALAELFQARGRDFMDLSVMHDNDQAIGLYEKLGFVQIPVFALKNKNSINEKLFVGPVYDDGLNPYAKLLVDEARRRGIQVEVIDREAGYFTLSFGGRSITCRESLSELTSAVAMSRCDDKAVTRRLLKRAGLGVPDQISVTDKARAQAFLATHGSVVVKPARGEQGKGISVDVTGPEELNTAIEAARAHCDHVILEQFVRGDDLRVVVIDFKVVAAAVRKPPRVVGDGKHTVRDLIEKLSRRRAAATGGESTIPMDAETERVVRLAGHDMDAILPEGEALAVRKTANLHTGGTIHDVTDRLHRAVVDAAVRAAQILDIPVVGLDFLVPSVTGPDHVIIEANERPGLANHEPQPTAERFIDLLFPQTRFAPPGERV